MTTTPVVSRKDLLTAVISPGKMIARVEIKEITLLPRQEAPLHFHPCPVVGVVMQGTIDYQVEGEPVQHLSVGDAFYEQADTRVAHFDNAGESMARFVAFYLLGETEKEIIRIL